MNWDIIGPDNGLSPVRRQAIIWANDALLLIGPSGTNCSETWLKYNEIEFNMSFANWRSLCRGLYVIYWGWNKLCRILGKLQCILGSIIGGNPQEVFKAQEATDRLSSHYIDVITTTMASQITSLTIVYSTVYSDADQRKHQSSASLAFVWGIQVIG